MSMAKAKGKTTILQAKGQRQKKRGSKRKDESRVSVQPSTEGKGKKAWWSTPCSEHDPPSWTGGSS